MIGSSGCCKNCFAYAVDETRCTSLRRLFAPSAAIALNIRLIIVLFALVQRDYQALGQPLLSGCDPITMVLLNDAQ